MKRMGLVLAAFAFALPAFGQSDDYDKMKDNVLNQIKQILARERTRVMERVGQIIDEELGLKPRENDARREMRKIKRQIEQLETALLVWTWVDKDEKLYDDAQKMELDDAEYKRMFDEHIKDLQEGRHKEGARGFKRLFYKLFKADNPAVVRQAGICAYNVACGYSLDKKKDEALDWYEISMTLGFASQPCGCPNHGDAFQHIKEDTDLDSVRNESRFKKITERFKKGD